MSTIRSFFNLEAEMQTRTSSFVTVLMAISWAGCANDPRYVSCGTAAMTDVCLLDTANSTGMDENAGARGSLHVPVKPPDATLTKQRADLQATMPSDVVVPAYRLDQYDLSVEYVVTNLDDRPGQFKIQLNGANEEAAWDPSLIMPADEEDPPAPPLAGGIPTDIAAKGQVTGVFREDQLIEAAIDLDQITRGNINPFAATLRINKDADSIQPLTPAQPPPPGSNEPPMQMPMGSPVPRAAFRHLVRVDLVLQTLGVPADQPAPHLTMEYSLRIRPHVANVLHDQGMNAPANELAIFDPAPYMP